MSLFCRASVQRGAECWQSSSWAPLGGSPGVMTIGKVQVRSTDTTARWLALNTVVLLRASQPATPPCATHLIQGLLFSPSSRHTLGALCYRAM